MKAICTMKSCNSPDRHSQTLMELQAKLHDLYLQIAQGAFIRSRAKWIEAGEKNSSNFSHLEKFNSNRIL